ncbi:MAG: ATP-binding protein [Methylotetracoccus sp.]
MQTVSSQSDETPPTLGASSNRPHRYEWQIDADGAEVERLLEHIDTAGHEAGIPVESMYRLLLVVEEVVTNAIKYGYADARSGRIAVSLSTSSGVAHVEVADDGDPFDPTQAPPPVIGASVEEQPIGGLGLHLIKELSDTVRYRRSDNCNTLTIEKRYGPAPSDQHERPTNPST